VGLELLGLDEQQIARAMSEKRRAQGSATMRSALDALRQTQPTQAQQVNAITGN
jgi:hypothetical protein